MLLMSTKYDLDLPSAARRVYEVPLRRESTYPGGRVGRRWTSLTRHFSSAHGTRTWPVEARWGASFSPAQEPVMFYSVTEERAEQWKGVTGK